MKRNFYLSLIISFVFILLCIFFVLQNIQDTGNQEVLEEESSQVQSIFYEEIEIEPGANFELNIEEYEFNNNSLPTFSSIVDSTIIFSPSKADIGSYELIFQSGDIQYIYTINIKLSDVDWNKVDQELRGVLGAKIDDFGISIVDLLREETFEINGEEIFAPASMAKLTTAILVLRDIDSGKYTLETTYPIANRLKFGEVAYHSTLPQGTLVTLDSYLKALISNSSNTAWYHLNEFLGGTFQEVNPRTQSELGVSPLYLDPHIGTANNLAKILADVYNRKTLSDESSNYLIELMKNATPFNREGIGLGVPDEIEFANKIGFLHTEQDLSYMDSAIVFGNKTDFVLVIMNKNISWAEAKGFITIISSLVYTFLDL